MARPVQWAVQDGTGGKNGEEAASDAYQRAGPGEQWLVSKMRELGRHLADRAVKRGYHRFRLALTQSVD